MNIRNCRLIEYAIVAFSAVLLGSAVGCEGQNSGAFEPTPEPRRGVPDDSIPSQKDIQDPDYIVIWHNGAYYRQNRETGAWDCWDAQASAWYPCDGPPYLQTTNAVPTATPPMFGSSNGDYTAADYGIVPDDAGLVTPRVWIRDVQSASGTTLTGDDMVDFCIAKRTYWQLPTDQDPQLLDSIGAHNIVYYNLQGVPEACVVYFNDITINNLVQLLTAMQCEQIESRNPYGSWVFSVDASRDYVSVTWNGTELRQIPLYENVTP